MAEQKCISDLLEGAVQVQLHEYREGDIVVVKATLPINQRYVNEMMQQFRVAFGNEVKLLYVPEGVDLAVFRKPHEPPPPSLDMGVQKFNFGGPENGPPAVVR
jgi:hypothetical protein